MRDRLGAPVRLVEVERVLAGLAVEGHEALRVDAAEIPLVANARPEVEHRPDVGAPDERPRGQFGVAVLVDEGGVLLRLVHARVGRAERRGRPPERVVRVVAERRPGSVLADPDRLPRVLRVKVVDITRQAVEVTVVPHVIAVQRPDVADAADPDRAFAAPAEAEVRQRRDPARVFRLRDLVQPAQDGRHVVGATAPCLRHGVLVADGPHADGSVVELLADQLTKLPFDIRGERLRRLLVGARQPHAVDEGHLGPHHQPQFVRALQGVLRVRVVGQSDGVRPDLLDQRERSVGVRFREGPPLAQVVLVHRDTAQRDRLAVEREAAVRVEAHLADPEPLGDAVQDGAARVEHLDAQRVEMRVASALPQPRTGDAQVLHVVDTAPCRERDRGASFGGRPSRGIHEGRPDRIGPCHTPVIGHQRADVHDGGRADAHGARVDPGTAEVVHGQVHVVPDRDERHHPVEASGHVEVPAERGDGRDVVVGLRCAVVRLHDEDVVRGPEDVRDVEPEGGEGPLVLTELPAVEPNVRDHACALELEPVPCPAGRRGESEAVPTAPSLVRGGGVGGRGVVRVPGVRQRHGLPALARRRRGRLVRQGVVLDESPTARERSNRSQLAGPGCRGLRHRGQGRRGECQQGHETTQRHLARAVMDRGLHCFLPMGADALSLLAECKARRGPGPLDG